MKIDRISITPVESVQATGRVNNIRKKVQTAETDIMAVSDSVQVYQSLLQKVKEIPAIREDRVEALMKQLERGEFKIDSNTIAEKLFSVGF